MEDRDRAWERFWQSGRVEDYLLYRGSQGTNTTATPPAEEENHAAEHRRGRHPGEEAGGA